MTYALSSVHFFFNVLVVLKNARYLSVNVFNTNCLLLEALFLLYISH